MDSEEFQELFAHPTPDFGPANYWFWQRIPTREEIDRQLADMLQAGYRAFYIQPRLAFPLERYLGEEYLAAYRYAIEKATTLGLKAGIYDDYNWNSGHAGGLTVKGHDEFRDRQLFWSSRLADSTSFTLEISEIKTLMGDSLGGPQGHWTYEGGTPLWKDWQLIRVVAYPEAVELEPDTPLVDLTEHCSVSRSATDGCEIRVNLPGEEHLGLRVTAFVAGVCGTSRHMNYLNRAATTRFIEVGYEPYRRAVGEFFGSTIFCMFMDHPHAGFYGWKQVEGNIQNTLMFDESLVEAFGKEHGYPIHVAWLSFLLPESRLTPKLRGNFFDTYGRLARGNFLGQVSDWAHKNGLQFAGHELFGFLGIWGFYGGYHVVDQRTDFGGDYFGIGRYKDISTVDAFNSNPQIDAKIGDSIARASGGHGCMLEQYYFSTDPGVPGAIGHWNLTFDEMRTQALRHTLFGTKQFIFHGYYLSDQVGTYELLASSRFDFAPGINYEPWFARHGDFAPEISRLSAFIYNAEPVAEIALMYPLSTFWAEGTDGIFGDHSGAWNQWFLENGCGFDVVDEHQLAFDPNTPGRIHAGPHAYRILVLPGVRVLRDSKLVEAIAQFVKTGGSLLLSGDLPGSTVEHGVSPSTRKVFEDLCRTQSAVRYFDTVDDVKAALPALMKTLLPGVPRVTVSGRSDGQLWSWTGRDENGYLVALFNESGAPQRVTMDVPSETGMPERYDLLTGASASWRWYQREDETTHVFADMLPREVACFRINGTNGHEGSAHLTDTSLRVVNATGDDGALSVLGMTDQPGKIWAQLATVDAGNAEGNGSSRLPATNRSELQFVAPAFPSGLVLEGPWSLTVPGRLKKAQIDVAKGWETQGLEDYAGSALYETTFDMLKASSDWSSWSWRIVFPQVCTSAEISVNGHSVGRVLWPPYEIILPADILQPVGNRLAVRVYNAAGNYYYHGSPYTVAKAPSGLVGHPRLMPVRFVRITEKGIYPERI